MVFPIIGEKRGGNDTNFWEGSEDLRMPVGGKKEGRRCSYYFFGGL